MKRALVASVLSAVVCAACASGGSPNGATDGPPGVEDAPPHRDTIIFPDTTPPGSDARPIDAPIDGPPDAPPDASPDAAVHVDARPIDAAVDARPPDAAIDAAPPPPDACVPILTQLLNNPTFDLSPAGVDWTEDEPAMDFELIGAYASPVQSTPFCAFLGGEDGFGSVTDFLYQDIVIPANTTRLEITGYYAVFTDETTTTTAYDTASVSLTRTNGSPIETALSVSNLTAVGSWTLFDHSFNVAGLSGQTVRLRVTSTVDDTDETDFLFDTFGITATHGCP